MKIDMRTEKDSLGELTLKDEAVYGTHNFRAVNNFPVTNERVNLYLIKSFF